MKLTLRSAVVGAVSAVLIAAPVAWAAGLFPGFPIVGSPAYCTSVAGTGSGTGSSTFSGTGGGTQFGQGGVGQSGTFSNPCQSTAAAGPAATGLELVPADTQLGSGQQPQTVLIPSALLGGYNTRVNRLIGGDFATNLWQRGTTPVSAASPTTTVIGPDRFGIYSASTQVTVIKETAAADSIPASGLYASARVQRPSSQTGTGDVCIGQVLDKEASAELIGHNGVLSFYALAGTNLSSTNSNLKVTVAYYTAADSATPLTNTDAWFKGTITGYAAAVGGTTTGTTGTVASGVATVPISTTWTRYSVYAPIPVATAAGTAITGVGVSICDTPIGTAGANDWFEIEGVQLQAQPSTATASMPAGITLPTGFEARSPAVETNLQQYYTTVFTEGAASISVAPSGQGASTTTCVLSLPFPQTMREVPTFAAAGTALGVSTWTVTHVVTNTALATPFLAATAGGSTTSMGNLTATVASGLTAGQTCTLTGAAGGSLLVFSAEP